MPALQQPWHLDASSGLSWPGESCDLQCLWRQGGRCVEQECRRASAASSCCGRCAPASDFHAGSECLFGRLGRDGSPVLQVRAADQEVNSWAVSRNPLCGPAAFSATSAPDRLRVPMPNLRITEIKAFVPSKDFGVSKQFYRDLGFTMASEGGGVAYIHFGHVSFLLQDFRAEGLADEGLLPDGSVGCPVADRSEHRVDSPRADRATRRHVSSNPLKPLAIMSSQARR